MVEFSTGNWHIKVDREDQLLHPDNAQLSQLVRLGVEFRISR